MSVWYRLGRSRCNTLERFLPESGPNRAKAGAFGETQVSHLKVGTDNETCGQRQSGCG